MTAFLNIKVSRWSNCTERDMDQKYVFKFSSIKSIRPAAWLAMTILACGAFGNSLQAQVVWLNDTLSGYTTDGVSLTTATSPQLIAVPGSSWTVLGAGLPKKLRTFKPAGAGPTFSSTANSAASRIAYKLSTDANNAIDRPVGYLTYKITPGASMANTFNANGLDNSYMEAGLGPTGMDVPSSAGQLLLWGRFYFNNSATSPQYKVRFYHLKVDFATQSVGSGPVTLNAGENTVKIWYNKSAIGVLYTPPGSSSAVTLAANSWVAYVNDTIAAGLSNTGVVFVNQNSYTTGTTPSPTVGKFAAFNGSSGHTYDFSLSDIYVADTAPSSGVGITSGTEATAQAGYPFSYTITSSGVTSPVYSTSPLPSGLSLDSSTGVISGTLDANATSTTIELTATGTGGPATANLALTVTPAPTVVPSFTSTGIASGFLTKTFSYSIRATVNETTPLSIPTSYAIGLTTPLPAGLSLDANTGIISGTPTALTPEGGTQITYTATNPFGTSAVQTLTITINPAPVFTWNNTSTVWNNATSWTNNAVPANSASTDIAAFGNLGSSATSVDVGTGKSIGGIVFNSGAYAYTWTGTDIIVGSTGSITNNSAAIQTFDNKVINNGGSPIWSSTAGGGMVFNGGIDLTTASSGSARTLTFAGAGDVTVSSTIASGGTSAAAGASVTFSSTGVNLLSGNNTYGGLTTISDGTLILSGSKSSSGYTLSGYAADIFPVLKVSALNALSPSAKLTGSSSIKSAGTLEFATSGNYTLNQYTGNNMNFSNSSGSATTLTFTNATNVLSTGGGRTLANKSANLTITFNGEVDITGNATDDCTISAVGPVVISNRVFNSNTNFTRSLEKLETGNLTMYGVNSYNGSTIVSRGTLSIPTGGSLAGCGDTIVKGGVAAANPASLNLAGAAGVVQVSTNGFVRGYTSESTTTLGTITSLQVQEAGTVEVALGGTPTANTWNTDGTISFAVGSKVSVTGTPVTGNTYTLMTASAPITFATGSPTLVGATGWALRVDGASLLLEETSVTDGFADYLSRIGLVGTAFDAKVDGVTVGLKYAFGSANGMPQNNGVTAVPVIAQLPDGDQQMTYTFDVKDDSVLTFTYQTSSDLVTWSAAQPVSAGTGSSTEGFVKKQAQATGSGKLFIRINVTR
jgi:autotransporter-associated beta strand protein